MNVLMGLELLVEMDLMDFIFIILFMFVFIGVEIVLNVCFDYVILQLDVDYQKRQVSLVVVKYNFFFFIGFKEIWGIQMLNILGEIMFNSNVYVFIKLLIFYWGVCFKLMVVQKVILLSKQYVL